MGKYTFGYTFGMPASTQGDNDAQERKLRAIFGDEAGITPGGSHNQCTVIIDRPLKDADEKLLGDENISVVSRPVGALQRMIRLNFEGTATGLHDSGDGEALQAAVDKAEAYLEKHGIAHDDPVPMGKQYPVNIWEDAPEA